MTKRNHAFIPVSEELLRKVKEFEGLRLEAYDDGTGVWTIGYGHTQGVSRGDKITEWYAEDLLKSDLDIVTSQVLELNVCKTRGQLDALTSFAFNVGIGRLKNSTLLKCIKRGETADVIKKEWLRWKYAGGRIMPGLLRRREWELRHYFEESEYLPLFNLE